jgi:hypothetical protein
MHALAESQKSPNTAEAPLKLPLRIIAVATAHGNGSYELRKFHVAQNK